jgi:hypothetical protein
VSSSPLRRRRRLTAAESARLSPTGDGQPDGEGKRREGESVATKSSSTSSASGQAQQTADRIRELNERIIKNARRAGETYLDAYEHALGTIAGYQESVARATPVDWMRTVLEAQASFTREFGNFYASTAREAMKKK